MSQTQDYQQKCKEETCGNYFIPGNNRKGKISPYCSTSCGQKSRLREWQSKHIRIKGKWYPI